MRNVLITGAASGLGKAMAQLFVEKNYNVLVVDIQDESGRAFVEEIKQQGYQAEYYHCNIGSIEDIESLYKEVQDNHQKIDVLINNAGVASAGTLPQTTYEEWQRLISLDLMSVIYITKAFLPLIKQNQQAHIVNIASFAGIALMPGMMSYNVAKSGVIAFSETLHGELNQYGIGVSVACPAFFPTNLVESMDSASDKTKSFVEKQMKNSCVSAEDVAKDIYVGIQKKQFMIISHKDSRIQYFLKRLFPNVFMRKKIKIFNKINQ